MRRLLTITATTAIMFSLLTGCVPDATHRMEGRVGTEGFALSVEGVDARASADVAPMGTAVVLENSEAAVGGDLTQVATALASPIALTMSGDLQPATPIELRFTIDESAIAPSEEVGDAALLIATQSRDGSVGLLSTQREGNVLIARTDHLSWFQPVQLDFRKALDQARTLLLESLGVELPAPECVGKSAVTSDGTEYSVSQGGAVYACIKARGNAVTVNLYAATAIPYRVTSVPAVTGGAVPGTDSGSILMTLASKWIPSASGGVLMGGGSSAQFEFSDATPPQFLETRQDAHMLIGAVLLNLIGVVLKPLSGGAQLMDRIGKLDCLSGALVSGTNPSVDASSAAAVFRAVLTCVASAGALISAPVAIVLALISAIPSLFVGSAIGLINEVTGKSTERVDVRSTRAPTAGGAPLGGQWLWQLPVVDGFGTSGEKEIAEYPQGGRTVRAADSTNIWVGCSTAGETTSFDVSRRTYRTGELTLALQTHTPSGMAVTFTVAAVGSDGRVADERQIQLRSGQDPVTLSFPIDGAKRLDITAQTSDPCGDAPKGYASLVASYVH